jgi:hypothetical protein
MPTSISASRPRPRPRTNWQASEDELVAALNAIDDPHVRRILERELWSYRQAFGSVGRTDLVLQLQRVHDQAFPDVQPGALDTYLFGGFATYPPGSEGLAAADVDVERFAGRYRLDLDLEDAPVPVDVTIVAAPGHLVGVDPGSGCITMVPFQAPPLPRPDEPRAHDRLPARGRPHRGHDARRGRYGTAISAPRVAP